MLDLDTLKKAWALLDAGEKRNAIRVLCIVVAAALSSALMVGSIFPFLAVLSDPTRVQSVDLLSRAYDFFGFQSTYGFLVALGLASFGTILLMNGLQMLRAYALARFLQMRMHSFSYRLLQVYLGQPYEYFLDHHSGTMAHGILSEAGEAVQKYLRPVSEFLVGILTAGAVVGLLVFIDVRVTLIVFVALGSVYAVIFLLTRTRLARLGARRHAKSRARFQVANEALSGIKDIKILGREQTYVQRYEKTSLSVARTIVSVQVISGLPQYAVHTAVYGGVILICLLAMDPAAFEAGRSGLGDVLPLIGVFAFAGQRLMPELARVYKSLSQLQYGRAAIDRVVTDMALKATAQPLLPEPPAPSGLKDTLALEHVSYSYPNATTSGIREVSLTIAAGEKIGIVGSTGAGKTTFADVILGLLRPQSGRMLADGVEIGDSNIHAWRQTVGYVPQDIFLVDDTITANIALGVARRDVDPDRIRATARLAQIDGFIRTDLPEGYDTEVGERGVRLSGGQRQRIGIARALYHDADLIVFDEATSALDNTTEKDLMDAIEGLPGDKTIMMIAHRLSTIRFCDRILVLDKGELVALGSWEDLERDSPHFRKLVQATRQG